MKNYFVQILVQLKLGHIFATVNVNNRTTKRLDVSDLSTKLPEQRVALPNVTTNQAQRDFLYSELLPEMKRIGIIEDENFAGFVRWAMEEASAKVGLNLVVMKKRSAGRKPGRKF